MNRCFNRPVRQSSVVRHFCGEKIRLAPAAALGLAVLSGCEDPPLVTPSQRLGAPTASVDHYFTFRDACSASLSRAELRQLQVFLRDISATTQPVVVSVPKACHAAQDQAREVLLRDLTKFHQGGAEIVRPSAYTPSVSTGVMRVVGVSAITVNKAGCEVPAQGCAVANNLAQMIAYPSDLISPRYSMRYRERPADDGAELEGSAQDVASEN